MPATGKPAQVIEALFNHAATLSVGSPALPIAFPEQPGGFDPATDAPDGKYLEVRIFPNRPAWEGVTHGKLDQGLLQVTVVWPKNKGLIEAGEAAGEVMAHFAKDTVLRSGETGVKVSKEPWASPPLSEDHELRVPVTIPWTA